MTFDPYQCAISYEIRELLVLPLVDLGLKNTKCHWLLDNIVVIGDIALIDTAMEQFRRIMTTAILVLAWWWWWWWW